MQDVARGPSFSAEVELSFADPGVLWQAATLGTLCSCTAGVPHASTAMSTTSLQCCRPQESRGQEPADGLAGTMHAVHQVLHQHLHISTHHHHHSHLVPFAVPAPAATSAAGQQQQQQKHCQQQGQLQHGGDMRHALLMGKNPFALYPRQPSEQGWLSLLQALHGSDEDELAAVRPQVLGRGACGGGALARQKAVLQRVTIQHV